MRRTLAAVFAGTWSLTIAPAFAASSASGPEAPTPPASISERDPPPIIIRSYDSGGLPATHRAATIATAAAIVASAGIPAVWVSCDGPVGIETRRCAAPLADGELAIRFVRNPGEHAVDDASALGHAYIDMRTRKGALATVFVDRVERLARAYEIDIATLLGRATAHEVGHLLLGTSSHAETGLMRAIWPRDAFTRHRADDWQFTTGDIRAMREAVRPRSDQ